MRQLIRGSRILEKDDAGDCTRLVNARACDVMRATRVTALDELLDKIPDVCPLLQTSLEWSREDRSFESFSSNSPSIDRIDNSKGSRVEFGHFEQYQLTFLFSGYICGNVWIISRRANTIKSDATCAELEMMALNLRAKMSS